MLIMEVFELRLFEMMRIVIWYAQLLQNCL